jgi:hypothetical protein
MSWNLIDSGPLDRAECRLEDRYLLVRETAKDDACLHSTAALRQAEAIRTGDKARLIAPDGAAVVYGFQVHPVAWRRFKQTHKALIADLFSTTQIIRERAAAQVARLHPEWVTCAPQVRPLGGGYAQQNA